MNKGVLLGKLTFDYRNYMNNEDFSKFKEKTLTFVKENKDLNDKDFFEKLNHEIPFLKYYNEGITRHYLSKIASGVNTIKIIAIIYLVASIILGLVVAVQLTS